MFKLTTCLQTSCVSTATGRFSSRQIEESTWSDVNVRYLCCGEHHPDHSTLCEFRKDNKDAFKKVFVDVLALAQEMKLLKKVGTISVDGTKIKANAHGTTMPVGLKNA